MPISNATPISLSDERLAALYRVSRALGASLNLDEVLNQVMDAAIELTGADRGFLLLFEDNIDDLIFRAARNVDRETIASQELEISRSVVREIAQTGAGVITLNAQKDPRFSAQESVVHFGLRSIMAAPLQARGQIVGAIYVDNKLQTVMFEQDDLNLLEAFANQAAVAIENAYLYSQTDQALAARVEELQTMQRIDRELNATLDFGRVMALTLEWAKRMSGADEGWVGLVEADEDELVVRVVTGAGAGETLELDDPLIQKAMHAAEPIWQAEDEQAGPWRLVAPVVRENRTVGLVGLARAESNFAPAAADFVARLADHAAIAIENARLYDQVKAANEAKSQFVSIVTHELRVPMTSIRGYTDLLRQGTVGPINDQQTQFLNTIRKNVERMAALISDLADISRIESGRLKIELGAVAVPPCVDETLDSLRPQIEGRSQTFATQLPGDLPAVYTDRSRLIQILTNLISNANKYTPDGGHISVDAQVVDGFVHVGVTDNGIGLSEEEQAQLFQQFFRSEREAVREQHGWGLGLHVTKKMVETLGGEMSVRSTLGEGSTFSFTMPIAQ